MATADTTRTARVEARIAPEALAVVRRAAELQGRSVSDFLVAAALKDAQRSAPRSAGYFSGTARGDPDHQRRTATICRRPHAWTRLIDRSITNDMASMTKPRAAAPL